MKKIYTKNLCLLVMALLWAVAFVPVKVFSQTKYEAESAALTGVSVVTGASDASGGAYVTGLDATTDKLVFTVNVATAGSYPLVFRYRNSCGACEKWHYIKINSAAEVYTQFAAAVPGWSDKNYGNINLNAGDRSLCWDGTFNGYPAAEGTYVYMAELECPSGGRFLRKGTITLIR